MNSPDYFTISGKYENFADNRVMTDVIKKSEHGSVVTHLSDKLTYD